MTSHISGLIDGRSVSLVWESTPPDWRDPLIYAPAIPGVLVALAGLWIAHWLTSKRERNKAKLDYCEQIKALVDDAVAASTEAWIREEGLERERKIKETKRLIQQVGAAATRLKRLTARSTIDVIIEVSELRRVATKDPFEDPTRTADSSHIENIMAAADLICSKIDDGSVRF